MLYSVPMRGIAIRAGMLRGETPQGLETSYIATPLTEQELVFEGQYPLSLMQDCLLNAEELLVMAIANTAGSSLRDYLLTFTDVLTSGDVLPSTDANGEQIIGTWGGVFDGSVTTIPCTPQPMEVIRRWQALSSYLKSSLYYYALVGNQILHTRSSVVLQCCKYSREDQETALLANGDMLLPDVLEPALVCGALSILPSVENAQSYRSYFNDVIGQITSNQAVTPTALMKQVQEAA